MLGDLNFEEPDSDVEFDDTQSQAAEESDDDSWSDEELNSTETTQLQLPEKTQEDVVIDNLYGNGAAVLKCLTYMFRVC